MTCETAGSPSASNATTSTISRTNHLAMVASAPEASVRIPMLWTKSVNPDFRARSLNFTALSRPATALASAAAISQPMIRITTKPIIFGMAARKRARAAASEVSRASPQLVTGVVTTGMPPIGVPHPNDRPLAPARSVGEVLGPQRGRRRHQRLVAEQAREDVRLLLVLRGSVAERLRVVLLGPLGQGRQILGGHPARVERPARRPARSAVARGRG